MFLHFRCKFLNILEGEIKFFNKHWDAKVESLGLEGAKAWYEEHFADLQTRWFGEKSAGYFQGKDSIRHRGESYPEARLILLMREPVSRLWSHGQHKMRKEKERLDAAGEERPDEYWENHPQEFIDNPGTLGFGEDLLGRSTEPQTGYE